MRLRYLHLPSCGLTFKVANADSGLMTGKMSQEFMLVCPYRDDRIAQSEGDYVASLDIAERNDLELKQDKSSSDKPEVFTPPNLRTVRLK